MIALLGRRRRPCWSFAAIASLDLLLLGIDPLLPRLERLVEPNLVLLDRGVKAGEG
jgi:hypothetical protein